VERESLRPESCRFQARIRCRIKNPFHDRVGVADNDNIADTSNNRVRFVDADFRPPAGS
jgi:hypothetical protein